MELVWDELADQQMTELEGSGPSARLAALARTLGNLEIDPHNPRLGTRVFTTDSYVHVRSTPTGHEDDVVLWTLGAGPDEILVMAISPNRP